MEIVPAHNEKWTFTLLSTLLNEYTNEHFRKADRRAYEQERWESVALLFRVPLHMPLTTNSLESTHGHTNQKTPRRNNFYMSIYRIVQCMMKKAQNMCY